MPKFALCFFGVCIATLLIALFDLSIPITTPIMLFAIILAIVFLTWILLILLSSTEVSKY